MIQKLWLGLICLAFAFASHVTVQVNRLPTFAESPALSAELASLLQASGFAIVPHVGPRGPLIAASLRFAVPHCEADGFLLPVADVQLTDVLAARFAEITGASYSSHALRMTNSDSILGARAARAFSALQAAFGLPAQRNGHTVLALFMPVGCQHPLPDMRSFWAPVDTP